MEYAKRLSCSIFAFICALSFQSCATGASRERFDSSGFNGESAVSGLFGPTENEDVNGFLPDQVHIKTRTQTFCVDHQFCLVDGRIYCKRLPPEGDAEIWRLLTKTGLPHADRKNFHAPKRIVELVADADALFALSDEGRLYRCYFDIKTASPSLEWQDAFGWPDSSPLILNDLVAGNLGWALGARRDHVLWYDDPSGNQHHFGTMGIETIYFLRSDGQELRYADTGLPSDFSHGILGPERGSFIAKSISASASTVFLMNSCGEMYTRLADFDTLGCDPMFFKYTYKKESYGLAGSDFWSNFTPWALPNEGWRRQPPVPLSGAARLTSRITILQTGQGNGARELRVAGLSPEGETGYYRKAIFDPEWTFRPAPLDLFPSDFLDAAAGSGIGGPRGERQERGYSGFLFEGNERVDDLSFEIPDFPIKEGDCTLIVHRGDESAELRLYPVEIWTYLKRYDPGMDGTPRLFHLTVKIPEGGFQGVSRRFQEKLDRFFHGIDLVLFSSRIEAMDSYLYIELDKDSASPPYLFLTRSGAPAFDKDFFRRSVSYSDRLVGKYADPDLDIASVGELSITNRSKIEEIIRLNERYRGEIASELELYRSYRASSGLSRWGYGAVDLITSITFLDQIDFPKIKTMTSYGGKIMEANEKSYREMAESREWVYAKLLELLDIRLAEYGKIIQAFDANEFSAGLGTRYRESFTEYFRLLGLPESIEGKSPISRGARAELRLMPEMPLFPGLLLTVDKPTKKDPDAKNAMLLELKDSAKLIYSMEGGGKPFRAKLAFRAVTPGGGLADAKGGVNGYIEWDGSDLKVWREKPFFLKELVFRAKADSVPRNSDEEAAEGD